MNNEWHITWPLVRVSDIEPLVLSLACERVRATGPVPYVEHQPGNTRQNVNNSVLAPFKHRTFLPPPRARAWWFLVLHVSNARRHSNV
ncbi:hypothetical protein ElyMa_001808100 [Elysia marginata]|uniref:Uncharacterized protein n=1 Tax=Elysia marginata TaxID=1093978 RepID=A0AAV4EFX5_9GAST|nr:hypothetical protein ElyMa_001808100 [Elysia marginata]